MKDMKKAVKWITAIAILSVVVLLVVLKLIDESNKVDFADEYIGIWIMADGLYHKSKEENLEGLMYEDFRKDDLKYVTSLEIFNTIRTETLVDLEKCPNLESLEIADAYGKLVSWYGEDWAVWAYEKDCGKLPSVPSTEKMKQFEAELEGVLQECKQLKELCIYNLGTHLTWTACSF
ncbi:MAG: hypothetical protein HDQ99_07875 [Lachnospiraceae bacterium]|nr:hypothetical protein [Lachnospiraceae bacterium]